MLMDRWCCRPWPKSLNWQYYSRCNEPAVELCAKRKKLKRPCYNRRGFLLGKEQAGILHIEELMIN
jgi:hypothetical protein